MTKKCEDGKMYKIIILMDTLGYFCCYFGGLLVWYMFQHMEIGSKQTNQSMNWMIVQKIQQLMCYQCERYETSVANLINICHCIVVQ